MHFAAKLARWALIIQELDLEIKYRLGKSNTNADMSRNPPSVLAVSATNSASGAQSSDTSQENEVSVKQRQDPEFRDLFHYIEDGILPEDSLQAKRMVLEHQRYAIVDGVLQYVNFDFPGVWRIAVPQSMRETLLEEAHSKNFAGHFAERKVYATLRKKYWWNKMRADVRRHCRACLVCATRRGPGRRVRPPLQPIPVGGPFHRVGVDVLKLPLTYEGNAYAVVFMDYFTKWPEVFAVPDQQATTIVRLKRLTPQGTTLRLTVWWRNLMVPSPTCFQSVYRNMVEIGINNFLTIFLLIELQFRNPLRTPLSFCCTEGTQRLQRQQLSPNPELPIRLTCLTTRWRW